MKLRRDYPHIYVYNRDSNKSALDNKLESSRISAKLVRDSKKLVQNHMKEAMLCKLTLGNDTEKVSLVCNNSSSVRDNGVINTISITMSVEPPKINSTIQSDMYSTPLLSHTERSSCNKTISTIMSVEPPQINSMSRTKKCTGRCSVCEWVGHDKRSCPRLLDSSPNLACSINANVNMSDDELLEAIDYVTSFLSTSYEPDVPNTAGIASSHATVCDNLSYTELYSDLQRLSIHQLIWKGDHKFADCIRANTLYTREKSFKQTLRVKTRGLELILLRLREEVTNI